MMKMTKSNAERQAALKKSRGKRGIFKRYFWLTDAEHVEMATTYKILLEKRDDNTF
jgi:hypothetical protein